MQSSGCTFSHLWFHRQWASHWSACSQLVGIGWWSVPQQEQLVQGWPWDHCHYKQINLGHSWCVVLLVPPALAEASTYLFVLQTCDIISSSSMQNLIIKLNYVGAGIWICSWIGWCMWGLLFENSTVSSRRISGQLSIEQFTHEFYNL